MASWIVELDDEFRTKVEAWDSDRQIELFAVQTILEAEGLSVTFALDLEGVPDWDSLGQPKSLMLVALLSSDPGRASSRSSDESVKKPGAAPHFGHVRVLTTISPRCHCPATSPWEGLLRD